MPVFCSLNRYRKCLVIFVATCALLGGVAAFAQETKKFDVLHIGTSGSLALSRSGTDEKAAFETLTSFIKEQTGFQNEIIREKDWQELVQKMVHGDLQLGVFQGYEFAWAQSRNASLKPLALAINEGTNRYAYLIARKDNSAKDFAGLKGQTLAVPNTGEGQLLLFVDRQSQAAGKPAREFFSKMIERENLEDAVDDVVDGTIQVAVVDRVGLEAYKRRKPGRFNQLKDVAHSEAFPPPLVAVIDGKLDSATLQRFEKGLLDADKSDRGQRLLNLFKLTGFGTPKADFEQVVKATLKEYPPPTGSSAPAGEQSSGKK